MGIALEICGAIPINIPLNLRGRDCYNMYRLMNQAVCQHDHTLPLKLPYAVIDWRHKLHRQYRRRKYFLTLCADNGTFT